MSEAKILYVGIALVAIVLGVWIYLDYQQILWKGLPNSEIIKQTKECTDANMCVHLRKNAYGEVKAVICDVCTASSKS